MKILYLLSISIFSFSLRIATAMGMQKARLLVNGRADSLMRLRKLAAQVSSGRRYWIHCASLGEFEQGRPIIEAIRAANSDAVIYLTFFSPSGYEQRKGYDKVDGVFYLPADTAENAEIIMRAFRADVVIFVKYEFWHYFLQAAHAGGAKCYSVSAIFRPNMVFFKPWGGFFRKILCNFDRIFVQNTESRVLLEQHIAALEGRVVVSGDTRFDRVAQIVNSAQQCGGSGACGGKSISPISTSSTSDVAARILEFFCGGANVVVAGSTWEPDQQLLVRLFNDSSCVVDTSGWKCVIVPHEIHDTQIDGLIAAFEPGVALRYSDVTRFTDTAELSSANADVLTRARILVVDCVGLLSKLYRYADLAYVGGGFGVGIHNILEAATWGVPIIFGPKYDKFQEARDLIKLNAAFGIKDYTELQRIFASLSGFSGSKEFPLGSDVGGGQEFREQCGRRAAEYVRANVGATDCIVHSIENNAICEGNIN